MPSNSSKSSRSKQVAPARENQSDLDTMKETLRRAYEGVKNERVPDKLQRLVDALREAEQMSKTTDRD